MGEQAQKVLTSFRNFWDAQERNRKILYIAIVALVILIAVIVTILMNRKDYVVLYSGLEAADAGNVYAEIQGMGYQADIKGGTITVPKGTEASVAMDLAMLGLPESGPYSIYTDNVDLFSTDAEKRFYEKVSTENKIKAAIESLNGITKADVNLAIPEQRNTVVQSQRQYPTVAVTLHLAKNVQLSDKQIEGIHNLVQYSLPGLSQDNVSLIDGDGIPLIANEDGTDTFTEIQRRMYIQNKWEQDIRTKNFDLFSAFYGDDSLAIAVNMSLNFDESVSEIVDYGDGSLQHSHQLTSWGDAVADGGVAGENNNIEEYPTVTPVPDNANWGESEVENTFLVDTVKKQVKGQGCTVEDLSISIVFYTDYLAPSNIRSITEAAAHASGIKAYDDNGIFIADKLITVMNLPKMDELVVDAVVAGAFGLTKTQTIAAVAALLLLLIVLLTVLAITSKAAKKNRAEFEARLLETMAIDEHDRDAVDGGFLVDLNGEPIDIPSLTDDSVETKEIVIRREIGEFAKSSPDIVAQLLKNWMRDA